jgi:hypothetical protein
MKRIKILAGILCLGLWACSPGNQKDKAMDMQDHTTMQKDDQHAASPMKFAMNMIGMNHVHIEYSAPSVKGRVIWGGLVPYDKVWVTGAHMATSIQFGNDLIIHGKNIAEGKYALFTIPGKETWTVIINKTWDQHLADRYDQKDDVLRFTVKPEVQNELTEQLTFEVIPDGDKKGEIIMKWEKLKIMIDIESAE